MWVLFSAFKKKIKMSISVALEESVDMREITTEAKQTTLNLRTEGAELEWQLICRFWQPFGSGGGRCTFQLVPIHGMNLLRTAFFRVTIKDRSYGAGALIDKKSSENDGWYNWVETCIIEFKFKHRTAVAADFIYITVDIKLKIGLQVTGVGNSSLLYNNRHLADVTLKCGDSLSIPAHKHILSTHSELFRTVFASTGFVEGQEGLYTIDSQHMKPEILEDVIRWMYLQHIDNVENKVCTSP
jgi:hypothetical protein